MSDDPTTLTALATTYSSPMMDAFELTRLGELALSSCRGNNIVALEIGAFIGQTTVFCLEVLKHSGLQPHWICVDPFEFLETADGQNPQGISGQFIENVKRSGMAQFVSTIMSTSERAVALTPPVLDLVIIDGFHSYEVCRSDLYNYAPRLTGGGLFIDDYGPAYPGVMQAIDEFLAAHPDFMVIEKNGL